MGNHDMHDYLRRIMLALCANGVPAEPTPATPGVAVTPKKQEGGV
jgi:hypothetical protein